VLDRLLDEERLAIEGISATSAGAMNAAVLAHGLTYGGRAGAKVELAGFWKRVSEAASLSPLHPTVWDRLCGHYSMESSPGFVAFDLLTRLLSPYQFNPLRFNPLRDVLAASVDFEELRRRCAVKLFLCATNVRTGKIKVFEAHEASADAVLASSCLPFLFHAVEIDGEAYWDGGYMGNPAIFPLIYGCESRDVVIVHINPICRPDVPTTAATIMNRINEISFNSSLMREMRAVAFVSRMIDDGKVAAGTMKRMLIHAIEAEAFMRELGVSSKLNADWSFLTRLCHAGRAAAERWLAANYHRLGQESTAAVQDLYL
jgi:NTE family protein